MKVHELQITNNKEKKRVGRGIGSGYGKTAGRGTKGQNSRSGGGVRPGFEGGQNPLAKRLPKKRGFASLNPTNYQVVNLSQLNSLKDGASIDAAALAKAGLIKKTDSPVKVLGNGEITKKVNLKVQAISATASKAVLAAGGKVEIVELTKKPSKTKERA